MSPASIRSSCIALVATLALATAPTYAQSSGSASSTTASLTASGSATSTGSSAPSASATVAPYMVSCPAELELQIGICLDTVARDGAVLPCNADDWWCNCNNWQGVLSCYKPCPDMQDQLDIEWNQQNCQGQHGFANLLGGNSSGTYLGSNIVTTGSNGATRAYYSEMPVASSTATASAWTWAPSSTGSSLQRSSSSATRPFSVPAGLLTSSLALVAASSLLIL